MRTRRMATSASRDTKTGSWKTGESTVQASEACYRALFEQAADAIVVFDPKTLAVQFFNDEACRRLGYSRRGFARLKISDFEVIESFDEARRHARHVTRCGVDVFETKHRTKHGTVLDVEVRAKSVCLGGKNLVQGAWRDITMRKQAEDALRISESHYRQCVENASDVSWRMNLDGKFTYVSPATKRLRGYTAEEVMGQPLELQIAPGSLQAAIDAITTLIENGRRGMTNFRIVREIEQMRKDKSTVWTEVVCDLVREAESGSIIILGVTRDISERKKAEEALRTFAKELERRVEERTAELRDGVKRLETILAAAHVVAWELDPDSGVLMESGPVGELFGRPSSFRHGNYAKFAESVHADDRAKLQADLEGAIQGKLGYHASEFRVHRPDGGIRWIIISGSVERDAADRPMRLRGVSSDITERKLAEFALARSQRALRVLTECGHALLWSTSEQRLLADVCRIAVEVGSYRMAWVGYAEHDANKSIRAVAQSESSKDCTFRLTATWANTGRGRDPTGEAIRTGHSCVCRDVAKDRLCTLWRKDTLKRGYASALALPLMADLGCLGALTIYSSQPDEFDDSEVRLLQQLAADLSFGIMALRGRAERTELQRQVLDVSEREQRRIGQDLHDGLGQSLTGIRYLVSAVQQTLASKSLPEAAELERITQMVGKTAQQVHDLALGLFPGELGKGGIIDALRELAVHTQDMCGISCRFSGPPTVELVDDSVARQVYRIAQEAVNNAVKHSKAASISIQLSLKSGRVVLTVKDDGVGTALPAGKSCGMGLRIMKYRAEMIGATLKITSARSKGTTMTCVLPPVPRTANANKEMRP